MFRSLIVVMLMATQFLAGRGGAAFLCICNDGSAVCICPGPGACTCCREFCDKSPESCLDKSLRKAEADHCCGSCDDTLAESDVFLAIDCVPCGCTYIPLMVGSVQPTTMARCTIMQTVVWNSPFVALLPTWVESDELDARLQQWRTLPPLANPDFFLTVVSTVVIRC